MMTIQELLVLREGKSLKVYKDSLGKPTAGIGHLLTPDEIKKYPLGSSVSEAQVTTWFTKDVADAKATAAQQAKELGITDTWFNTVLISVNFQLGDFKKKFPTTFNLLKTKKYVEAVDALNNSLWNKQTPVRVKDFVDAIKSLK